MELIEYLKPGWNFKLGRKSLTIEAPNEWSATKFAKTYTDELAITAAKFGFSKVTIIWLGCVRPLKISAKLTDGRSWFTSMLSTKGGCMANKQVDPVPDVDLALEAYSSEYTVWITRMSDQKVLLCNQLAVETQSKDPAELLGESIVPLWDNDPLEQLMEYLQRDRVLINYENPGYRWVREGSSPIWKRARYVFVTDKSLTTFLGQPCRISFTKSAEPV